MSGNFRKKITRGRNPRSNCNDNKNNFRNQDNSLNFNCDRTKPLFPDLTTYIMARFLMGNEVQIITEFERLEGVLRKIDTNRLGLSKVMVFENRPNESVSIMKGLCEFIEVNVKDIRQIKMLNINGKLESVILDQEIVQRKQISKPNLNEDKNLVPYFDEDESQLHSNDDDDDLNTHKGDQNCWYPEIMLKVNEERFNLKKTFSEKMEEYTTQIDLNDPLLKEKVERAERLAKEIENENNMKRGRLLDDDDGQDEEMMFSAVVPSSALKPETPSSAKLNPNAPEFRPRQKLPEEVPESVEEITDNCQSMSLETVQQHQQQQQQQQQMFQIHRFAPIHPMPMQPQITPQIPAYPPQRMIHNQQWNIPIPGPTSGQYVLQPYIQPNPVIQHMIPARQMQPEAVQPGSVYYQFNTTPFLIPQDHTLGVSEGSHLYPSNIDTNNQINHTNSLHHPMRQTQMVHHIPIQMSIHHQQQQQNPQPQQLNAYYPQSQHPPAINSTSFQHLIMNQQQPQLQNGAPIQGYITNGRQ